MMTASSPTIEISKKDDQWTMKTSTLMSSSSNTFKLGEEYEETMMGGRSIKVKLFCHVLYYLLQFTDLQNTATVEDNKLIISSQSDRGKSQRYTFLFWLFGQHFNRF
jgi:hypothetical protein